jgi:aconitase B
LESRAANITLSKFKENYEGAVAERKGLGVVPKPLDAETTANLVYLIKTFSGSPSTKLYPSLDVT